jgi:hypothetical protein
MERLPISSFPEPENLESDLGADVALSECFEATKGGDSNPQIAMLKDLK